MEDVAVGYENRRLYVFAGIGSPKMFFFVCKLKAGCSLSISTEKTYIMNV